MRFLTAIIFFLFVNYDLYGQSQSFKCYTDEDGLPNAVLYRVCKDKHGLLWISTTHGLSCFNGNSFTNYSRERFKGSFIIGLCCDGNNRVWMAEHNQISNKIFYIDHGQIEEFGFKDNKQLPVLITDLSADVQNRIWVVNKDMQAGYINSNKIYVPVNIKSTAGDKIKIYKVFAQKDSSVLLATSDGIYCLDKSNNISPFNAYLPRICYYSITSDIAGNMYFGSDGRIYICNNKQRFYDSINTGTQLPIYNIAVNKTGTIWFAKGTGYAVIINKKIKDYSSAMALENVFINDIYYDNDVVFLATNGKGLYLINHGNILLYDERAGFKNTVIAGIKKNGNDLYAGSFGGVYKYHNDSFLPVKNLPIPVSEIVKDLIFSGNYMWVVTPFNIWRYDLGKNSFTKYPYGGMCLCADENGNILIGGYSETMCLDAKTGAKISGDPKSRMFNFRTLKIIYNPKSGYWFGTAKGLFNYNNGVWRQFYDNNSPLKAIASSIVFDDSQNLWIATHDGIYKLNTLNNTWETFTSKNGLSSTYCHHVFYDGKLWIGTEAGLNSFDGKQFKSYTEGYGLPHDLEVCEHTGNDLWISTNKGVYRWNIDEEGAASRLNDIVLHSECHQQNNYNNGDTLILAYKQNYVFFDFVSPNYQYPENIVYEYCLKGADDTFRETKNHNLLFSSLSPGTYHLKIKAKLKNDLATSNVLTIIIIVLKPYWQELWFILLVACFIALIIIYSLYKRIELIKAREKQKTQRYTRLLQLKQEATNALISPHFIFNSLNSIQHFINKSDAVSANRFLSKFAGLIRATMENATNTSIKLSDEINILEKYLSLEAIRLPRLTYDINIDEDIDTDKTFIPSMLIQPYAENAIWHGITPREGNGHVKIDIIKAVPPYLIIRIEDNGVGINPSSFKNKKEDHNSFGMEINKRRLDIIHKLTGYKVEFRIVPIYTDSILTGTLVELSIPYKIKSL